MRAVVSARGGRLTIVACTILISFTASGVEAQTCNGRWADIFPGDGFNESGAYVGAVDTLVAHDTELHLGGYFPGCMNRFTYYVARWNGRRWAGVGAGLDSPAHALIAFSDPNTPAPVLFAGTDYGVYRAPNNPDDRNEAWAPIAVTDAPVRALAVYDGALYAGGEFADIGGLSVNYIARWTGAAWEEVGGGVDRDPNDPNGPILALTVFDDGGGEALFAGGTFLHAGGIPANRIARWRDGTWSALGDGITDPSAVEVETLAGWGDRLYVGGTFTFAGTRGIAAVRYDPNDPNQPWHWSTVGAGVGPWLRPNGALVPGAVLSLAVLDVGGSTALYVGGTFESLPDPNDPNDPNDALPARRIAKWNGATWSAMSGGFENVPLTLVTYDDSFGPAVYAGGTFDNADGLSAPKIARFKGGKWSPLGRAPQSQVFALCSVEAWHRPRLFVGGAFQNVGDLRTGGLASWDGVVWSTLAGAPSLVHALTSFDDGSGLDLFVGTGATENLPGYEDDDDSLPGCIARGRMVPQDPNDPNECNVWGWRWTNTVDPNDPNIPLSCNDAVCAFAEFQDLGDPNHPGPMLYAAGEFTEIDGRSAAYIARLNLVDPTDPNHPWEEVGVASSSDHPQSYVYALAVFQEPNDAYPALYAAGRSALSAGQISKWSSGKWSTLAPQPTLGVLQALAVHAGDLYAGGQGGEQVAKWDGANWSGLGCGFDGQVFTLHEHDDGDGPALYAGGYLHVAYNCDPNDLNCGACAPIDPAGYVLRWSGSQWEKLGAGAGDHVYALATLNDGLSDPDHSELYVGGHFLAAGNASWADTDSQFIARWGCITACRGDLNHDGSVGFADINPFILALSNPAAYAAAHAGLAETDSAGDHYTGGLVLFLGDLNCDGTVGFADINPFVQRVSEGCCSAECGPCELLGERGMNAMNAAPGEGTGGLSPEQMAAWLGGNVDAANCDDLLLRLAEHIAQAADPAEAAYWEAVYEALSQ